MIVEEDDLVLLMAAIMVPQGMRHCCGNGHAFATTDHVMKAFDLRGEAVSDSVADNEMLLALKFRIVQTAEQEAIAVHRRTESPEISIPSAREPGSHTRNFMFVLGLELNRLGFERAG